MHVREIEDVPLGASLSDRVRALILGSLLGDGSLRLEKPYRNARFTVRHAITQREYFMWKVRELHVIASPGSVHVQAASGFVGSKEKLHFQSRALEALTEIYRRTYDHGKLRIRRKWLNLLTPLSLAVWWCDDGSLIGNTRRGVLCTDGFDEEEVKVLAQYLEVVWGVRAHVGAAGRTGRRAHYPRIWIRSTVELKKFLSIIAPHIPVPSMLPKVIMLYRDPKLQQRWISELERVTPFAPSVIRRYCEEKRARWKRFRK